MIRRIRQNIEVMKIGIKLGVIAWNIICYIFILYLSGVTYWADYLNKFEKFASGVEVYGAFKVSEYMSYIFLLVGWTIIIAKDSLVKDKTKVEDILSFLPIEKYTRKSIRILYSNSSSNRNNDYGICLKH